MVRTWRPERDRRVLIVLDTGAWQRVASVSTRLLPILKPLPPGGPAGLAMDAALLLAALASRAGDRVDSSPTTG